MKKYCITNRHSAVNIINICVDEWGDPDVNAPQSRETALFDSAKDAQAWIDNNFDSESDTIQDWIIEAIETE